MPYLMKRNIEFQRQRKATATLMYRKQLVIDRRGKDGIKRGAPIRGASRRPVTGMDVLDRPAQNQLLVLNPAPVGLFGSWQLSFSALRCKGSMLFGHGSVLHSAGFPDASLKILNA
jgi:hypothetical protein